MKGEKHFQFIRLATEKENSEKAAAISGPPERSSVCQT